MQRTYKAVSGPAITVLMTAAGGHFFYSARRKECRVVTLHHRLTTMLRENMDPARRVATGQSPLVVARRLFRLTKLRSSRLDWRLATHNGGDHHRDYRPL